MDFGYIQVRYHSRNIVNGLGVSPVPQNPMLEKRILTLSPIGKKLAVPYLALGGHLGFWPVRYEAVQNLRSIPAYFLYIGPIMSNPPWNHVHPDLVTDFQYFPGLV